MTRLFLIRIVIVDRDKYYTCHIIQSVYFVFIMSNKQLLIVERSDRKRQ